ncbi:hypothetical protein [Streptomyces sp. NPDC091879]|uniref:hypothetical protein n=1 Tax=Streptomyces sp. NPDC091879 TaxID=3366006 RepID=UPI003816B640
MAELVEPCTADDLEEARQADGLLQEELKAKVDDPDLTIQPRRITIQCELVRLRGVRRMITRI